MDAAGGAAALADANPCPSSSNSFGKARVLQFAPFQSMADEGFWRRLSSLKLDTWGIDDSPIDITGFYAPSSYAQVSKHLTLLAESFPFKSGEASCSVQLTQSNRNKCPCPGVLYNTNTLEDFHALDKRNLLKLEAEKIWSDILCGKAEEDSSVLSRFLLISFADLKKWKFHYWFAFPALVLDPPAILINLQPASKFFSLEEAQSLSAACNEWRNSPSTTDVPFFLVSIGSNSHSSIRPLKDWEDSQCSYDKLLFGFYDPCHLPNNPGWPLRNFLTLIGVKWKLEKVHFFCYREKQGLPDLDLSLVGEARISISNEWRKSSYVPKAVGWELNKGKLASRCITLAESMDPTKLAVSAANLNLKLMRWRTLPSLDLNLLSSTKCLLIGAGTLGCQVARMLMAWGVRKITLIDNGRVAMSNPLRQSLYTFDDCLNGGDYKALAAAKSLKRVFPAVEAEGVCLSIPMPGHPILAEETSNVIENCKLLENLINAHDATFLLTDTRESRWLPTLLCANANKIAITAALGFDSFLVMRHGACPIEVDKGLDIDMKTLSLSCENGRHRLGCYFCNDVVAPIDSTSNRTLDQQCTVTRPGLAPIASSLAVELLVGMLHHPDRINAPGETGTSSSDSSDLPLGILPHQIRGSLSQFSQMTLLGYSSNSCTACCNTVVSEYRRRGMDFVLQAINYPTFLEDLTGLTDIMNSAASFQLDWENDVEGEDV